MYIPPITPVLFTAYLKMCLYSHVTVCLSMACSSHSFSSLAFTCLVAYNAFLIFSVRVEYTKDTVCSEAEKGGAADHDYT